MPNNNSDEEREIPPWGKPDRKRGILTQNDREFLTQSYLDEEGGEPDKQTIRDKRYRIRERLKNAFLDFNYLINLKKEDREQVFEYLAEEGGPTFQIIFEMMYLGITGLDGDPEEELELDTFVNILHTAIVEAERDDRNYLAKVSLDIDIERTRPEPETVLEKMLEGNASIEEFIYYVEQEGDMSALLTSVVEREEPLKVTAHAEDSEMQLISVDRAKERLEEETEILDEED